MLISFVIVFVRLDEVNCTNTSPVPLPPLDPFPKGNCSTMSQMYECHSTGACIPVFWRFV